MKRPDKKDYDLNYNLYSNHLDKYIDYLKSKKIDWEVLRKKYFNECTYKGDRYKGLTKINFAPHDLFEWFKSNLIK